MNNVFFLKNGETYKVKKKYLIGFDDKPLEGDIRITELTVKTKPKDGESLLDVVLKAGSVILDEKSFLDAFNSEADTFFLSDIECRFSIENNIIVKKTKNQGIYSKKKSCQEKRNKT